MAPTPDQPKAPFRVIVTGYGPFSRVSNNPSWLAVAPLHNTTIRTPSSSIHITAIGPIEVAYDAVLSVMPGLHARPPRLPPSSADSGAAPPPPEGYDLVFSLGAGLPGTLSLEQVGHKSGYSYPGVDGKLAPVVSSNEGNGNVDAPSAAERAEADRLGEAADTHKPKPHEKRGFAGGYEKFPEDLRTEVDVQSILEHLKNQGESRVRASTDAGHYLCDFICYCSLAESQRPLFYPESSDKNARRSKSLFMHVPLEGDPHTIEEMTEAVRQIVAWICVGEKALPAGEEV